MMGMFNGCGSIKVIDVSNFDTSNVTNFSDMFEDMYYLEKIIGLEKFDTSSGKFFMHMFENCYNLRELDLSSFDTRNAVPSEKDEAGYDMEGVYGMLDRCYALSKLTIGNNFSFVGNRSCRKMVIPTPQNVTETLIYGIPHEIKVDGADGNWYTVGIDGYMSHVASDIPSFVTETYYASKYIADSDLDSEVLVKHGTLLRTAKAIRIKNGLLELYKPSQFVNAIINLKLSEDKIIDGTADVISNNMITSVRKYGFYQYGTLTSVDLPLVSIINDYGFYKCLNLETVNIEHATDIGNFAFTGCGSIVSAAFPLVEQVGIGAFDECLSLASIDMPLLTDVKSFTFRKCESLLFVDLSSVQSIDAQAFYSSGIETLILRSSTVCALLNSNAFSFTPIADGTGYIYVPSSIVDEYKTADGWSEYADQIRAIEDYPEIVGSVV